LLAVDVIFINVILPVLLLVGVGAVLQRGFELHVPTLSRITLWVLVPTFLFVKVYDSTLTWQQIGGVVGAMVAPMLVVGAAVFFVMRRLGAPGPLIAAVVMSCVVVNAGNFGIPVAQLVYEPKGRAGLHFVGMTAPTDGVAVQALAVIVSNLLLWCLGYSIMAMLKGDGLRGVLGYFKLPMLYAIAAAFVLRDTDTPVPPVLDFPIRLAADATVPIMLLTLGAQLAASARWPKWRIVGPVMIVKLIVLPAVTAGFVVALGLWPWPGAQLVIAAAAPAAVNILILSLEMDGDAELAADCIFWTTVGSAVTVSAALAVVSIWAT